MGRVKGLVRALITVTVTMLLAACGGSRETTSATPQEAVTVLRARALAAAATAVSPEEAARQLLDFAESQFPQYFPSSQATAALAPFVYRYYSQTGIYVGVVITSGQGYNYLGVYVMGGPFGTQPVFVGPLASFITPVEPATGPGPTGVSNGCYDQQLAYADTPGTRYVITERSDAAMFQDSTYDWRVIGPTTFEGHAVTDSVMSYVQGHYPEGIPEAVLKGAVGHLYTRRTGPAEITYYGELNTVNWTETFNTAGISYTTTTSSHSKMVYTPPWVSQEASLPLGGSLQRVAISRTVSSSTTTTGGITVPPIVVGPIESVYEDRPRATFVRRERITVPAGTFDACVFEHTYPGSPPGLIWVADGKGFQLKMQVTYDGRTTTSVAVSVRFNGQAVTN